MASVNKAILIGHLGKDPKTAALPSGGEVVSFSVATAERWKDKTTGEAKERTQWHQVVVFNENLAKIAKTYLRKGSKVFVSGQIESRKYVDQAGADRYMTEIVLRPYRGELVLLEKPERPAADPDAYGSTRTREPASAESRPRDGFADDDIPF